MEQKEWSETSAYRIQTPWNYPEVSIHNIFLFTQPCEAMIRDYVHELCVVLRQRWTSEALEEALRRFNKVAIGIKQASR